MTIPLTDGSFFYSLRLRSCLPNDGQERPEGRGRE